MNNIELTILDAQALGSAYFGQGILNRPIFFTDTQCTGMEDTLTECLTNNITSQCSQCTHAMDAGVKCAGLVGPCQILGFTKCCNASNNNNCEYTTQQSSTCFCDRQCRVFNDCCNDISITCSAGKLCTTAHAYTHVMSIFMTYCIL